MRDSKLNRATPAALAAFARSDMDNFLTAATPGIEAQEAAGQATFVASATLPKEMRGCTREQFETMGFRFGPDADDIFVSVQLPAGWKKKATDHSMWSDLVDDKGRKRAAIFYKAAFYDRNASINLVRRYGISSYEPGSDDKHFRCVVKDGNTVIHDVGETDSYDARQELEKVALAWLTEKFPEWNSPLAYWD